MFISREIPEDYSSEPGSSLVLSTLPVRVKRLLLCQKGSSESRSGVRTKDRGQEVPSSGSRLQPGRLPQLYVSLSAPPTPTHTATHSFQPVPVDTPDSTKHTDLSSPETLDPSSPHLPLGSDSGPTSLEPVTDRNTDRDGEGEAVTVWSHRHPTGPPTLTLDSEPTCNRSTSRDFFFFLCTNPGWGLSD